MERPYPGAFGVMGNLSEEFPGRVHNTPISEQAMVGMGIGRALSGRPTIVEIMFGDFTTLIVDQVRQQATKITWMYGRHIPLPLVIRTASGGRRGYGPTHSQSLETMFIGVPNLNVYVVSPFGVPRELFLYLMATGYPSIVFEDKDLYGLPPIENVHPAYRLSRSGLSSSFSRLSPVHATPSLCIVTYGNAARIVIEDVIPKLASDYEIFVDVLVFELISPLDVSSIADLAARSKKILVVEEGDGRSGITSSLVSWDSELAPSSGVLIRWVSGSAEIGANEFSEDRAKLSAVSVVDACVTMANNQRN
jgi:pyruvate/2-oxoglutarate/acetoin dehydrogenase E1 component